MTQLEEWNELHTDAYNAALKDVSNALVAMRNAGLHERWYKNSREPFDEALTKAFEAVHALVRKP